MSFTRRRTAPAAGRGGDTGGSRGIPVPMADGTVLPTDHYHPSRNGPGPTVLVRSPVGRIPMGLIYGQYFARRGFHVIVQETRDVAHGYSVQDPDSEREDGLSTVAWLREQPWFDGTFVMYGASATGYVQWALAHDVPECKAMSVQISASSLADAVYPGGAFALESSLYWCASRDRARILTLPRRVRRALDSGRPVHELDTVVSGMPMPFFQELLANGEPGSPLRTQLDAGHHLRRTTLPVHFLAGWHDVFLPGQLRDYQALRAAGHRPRLTIGPWYHCDRRLLPVALREAAEFFRSHLTGAPPLRGQPVRIHVTGAKEWREYPDWPPPGTSARPWYLHADGGLRPAPPAHGTPRRYRYDPADPTPVPRGPVIFGDSRPEDCRPLEKRSDVLTYTSDPLPAPMELIGPVTADIHLRSSRTHTDCGVRICDVHPDGTSMNVCEGIRRVSPGTSGPRDADGVTKETVDLWPTAHRFPAGHRLRVHLCSGGHPRVARHTGSAALLDTSGILLAAEQEIFHDATRHSVIHLPVSPLPAEGIPPRPGIPGEDEDEEETEPGEWAPDFFRPEPGTW
ncbi:CocE/NonD family hydrolase [Streptosporangium nondiastaticum]|nr:CocE/NonD family hydrolase [Streptosporangium nondiastaticum]